MSTLGTFDAFTAARLGIYAAQQGLKVTGNNVSNINTAGYTRQRLNQVSLKTGGSDRYAPSFSSIGNGTLVSGINQIRDPYLDIRYRSTNADVGYHNTMLEGLQEIASILDEVGKGGSDDETYGDGILYAQLQDLSEKLRSFSASPTSNNESLVRSSASALTTLFHNYAQRLDQLQRDTEADFKNSITDINDILGNIQNLNRSIRECELNGDKALELRDERNRQIDSLSEYMDIRVIYSEEDVGAGVKVEKLTILLEENNPDPKVQTDNSMLIDGLYATQLSVPEKTPKFNPKFGSNELDDADMKDFMYLKKDGSGTNDPNDPDIDLMDNDEYKIIHLGKLLDTHGKEWEKHSTESSVTTKTPDGSTAKYQYTISYDPTELVAGDEIKIGDTKYKLTEADLTSADPLAKFIVDKLQALPDYGNYDYTIEAEGSNIVFTAKNIGAIGSDGPEKAPDLKLIPGGDKDEISLGPRKTLAVGADIDPNPPTTPDIDPVTGTETTIVYRQNLSEDKWERIDMKTEHTREIALDDNDLHGKLQAQRELLTEEGNFASANDKIVDENALEKRGIPYYQKSFDLLAQTLAEQYNKLNVGYQLNQNQNYIDKEGNELTIAGKSINRYDGPSADQKQALIGLGYFLKGDDDAPVDENGNKVTLDKAVADFDAWLKDSKNGAVPMGGILFSNSNGGDDPTGINASNIDISHSWSSGAVSLVPKYEVLFLDAEGNKIENTTQNVNADHMVSLIDKALEYRPQDLNGSDAVGPLLFKGSFNDMFSNMMGLQGDDARVTAIKLTNYNTTLVELDSSRESVSGVDLNDEAMNMMQYQKAYSAACRLMTVIDEALDRLVNNTGAVGR